MCDFTELKPIFQSAFPVWTLPCCQPACFAGVYSGPYVMVLVFFWGALGVCLWMMCLYNPIKLGSVCPLNKEQRAHQHELPHLFPDSSVVVLNERETEGKHLRRSVLFVERAPADQQPTPASDLCVAGRHIKVHFPCS